MPFNLSAIHRGYGECVMDWKGDPITLRYRALIDHNAFFAMRQAAVGELAADGVTRFPDITGIFNELLRILLPSTPETPEHERGWDVERDGVPVPVTFQELTDLPMGLPQAMLVALFTDVNSENPKKLSLGGSRVRASSEPPASPTTTTSSAEPNGQASTQESSVDLAKPVKVGSAGTSGFE